MSSILQNTHTKKPLPEDSLVKSWLGQNMKKMFSVSLLNRIFKCAVDSKPLNSNSFLNILLQNFVFLRKKNSNFFVVSVLISVI